MVYYDKLDTNMNVYSHMVIGQNSAIDYFSIKFNEDSTGSSRMVAGLLLEKSNFRWYIPDTTWTDSVLIIISEKNDTSKIKYFFKNDSLCLRQDYRFYCWVPIESQETSTDM